MKTLFLIASIFAAISPSFSQVLIDEVNDSAFISKVQTTLPGKIVNIYKTEIKGIFEVHTENRQIVYTDSEAKYYLIGAQLVDFKTKTNFSQERKAKTDVIKWDQLPNSAAFTVKKGDGTRKVAVFTDPDCPHCKKLEDLLKEVNNVTISYFLLPIPSLHPNAINKAASVLCSPDKAAAWSNLMEKKIVNKDAPECNTSLDVIARFASAMQIRSTPTIINNAGQIIEGAPNKIEQLNEFISK